jgi:hypothetical protein
MKKILILAMAFMVIGQIAEIQEQTLNYNEYIEQYAVIRILNGTTEYYTLCSDCTSYITVKKENTLILNTSLMTQLDTGLFGYLAIPSKFESGITYRAFINTTSPTWGKGFVMSTFTINKEPGISNAVTTAEGGGLFDLSGLKNILLDVVNILISPIKELYNNTIKPYSDIAFNFANKTFGFLNPLLNILWYFLDIFKWIITGLYEDTKLFINNPINFIVNVAIPFIVYGMLSALLGIALLMVTPLLFFEFLVLIYAIMINVKDIFDNGIQIDILFKIFSSVVDFHYKVISNALRLFSGITQLIIDLYERIGLTSLKFITDLFYQALSLIIPDWA